MTKNKKIGLIVIASVIAILLLGGVVLVLANHRKDAQSSQAVAPDSNSTNNASGMAWNTVPLSSNQGVKGDASPNPSSSSNSAATGLRQPNTANPNQATAPTTNQSTSASKAQPNPFDPSSFAQYDKYKDDSSALIAEVQAGTGTTLEVGKKAAVYYRGWLTNGTMFDQSRADSSGNLQTFSFTLGDHQVITGWEQALAGMKVGAVRLLVIPPSVGYGNNAQGSIPASSVLVFQVQLVSVE